MATKPKAEPKITTNHAGQTAATHAPQVKARPPTLAQVRAKLQRASADHARSSASLAEALDALAAVTIAAGPEPPARAAAKDAPGPGTPKPKPAPKGKAKGKGKSPEQTPPA